MSKKPFVYALRQRLIVPNTDGLQGIVTSRTEYLRQRPNYLLVWKDGHGNDASVWFTEEDLQLTQFEAARSAAASAKSVRARRR